ncbi:MAG TPA: 4Fe-4S binding protein [Dehalococcoidales bacterium]|nr:4Fe-4S binding protein [Dehalococcoidales bacterium]
MLTELGVVIDQSRCVGCGLCVEICPAQALVANRSKVRLVSGRCNLCGRCDRICICAALTYHK